MSWSAVLGRLISCSRNEFSADKAPLVARRCFASSSNNSPSPTFPTSSSPQKTQPGVVGFVGLGAMGSRIALNLSRSVPLVACDTSQAAVNAFIASAAAAAAGYPPSPPHSIAPARSVAQLFEKASELQEEGARQLSPAAVLTSLPSAAAVRAAWLGEEGLIRRAAAAALSRLGAVRDRAQLAVPYRQPRCGRAGIFRRRQSDGDLIRCKAKTPCSPISPS